MKQNLRLSFHLLWNETFVSMVQGPLIRLNSRERLSNLQKTGKNACLYLKCPILRAPALKRGANANSAHGFGEGYLASCFMVQDKPAPSGFTRTQIPSLF